LRCNVLESSLGPSSLFDIGWEENESGCVFTCLREFEAGNGTQESIRNLGKDTCAVTGTCIAANSSAVLEVGQGGQSGVDNVMSRSATQGSNHCQATGVLVERWVVQTSRSGRGVKALEGGHYRHAKSNHN
jgi:hypothetical protein